MGLQNLISIGFLAMGAGAVACFVLLVVAYQRNERKERGRARQAKKEIAEVAALFQTMRDIIIQQKKLAREFNKEIDGKMGVVKQLLAQGVERNERLYEQQQALGSHLREAQAQLESLQRQTNYLREALEMTRMRLGAAVPERPTEPPPAPAPAPAPAEPPVERQPPPLFQEATPPPYAPPTPPPRFLEPLPTPVAPETGSRPVEFEPAAIAGVTSSERSLLTGWPPDADPEPFQAHDSVASAKPQASDQRDAFRALLGLDAVTPPPQARPPEPAAPRDNEFAGENYRTGDNGRERNATLRKRVLEYSEAGMSVAEIAHELGVGKGEVRLMLSLARQRKPGM